MFNTQKAPTNQALHAPLDVVELQKLQARRGSPGFPGGLMSLQFDITAPPPSAEALMAARREEKRLGWLLMLILFCLVGGLVVTCGASTPFVYVVGVAAMAVMLAVVVMLLGADYEDQPTALCAEFYALCQATPEGQVYRQQVLSQGREFVVGEHAAMQRWAEGKPERDARNTLYDIAK
jgi:hypothetical protein